ncbi:cold shock and DUF1294 domain-containing protein [Halomonas sp. I5-271120]|uniref:cold shock and DUF1294 domain-containing protein n=1 Tax=Halomonas sp. I5-271120 TaxID=3061632 RepID=UPI002715566F|nr:cold shock and DUF1294 domain-containing protein [Halomonas sp. I5-271120]
MRGRIADWKDDRGFGFISPDSGGDRLFFHVSGMARGASRPSVGDSVSYEMSTASDGKARAVNVRPAGLGAVSGMLMSKRMLFSAAALLPFPVLWRLVDTGKLPASSLSGFAGMSALTFVLYGLDKWAAQREAQRTSENTLHFCALLGGWPGALLAQQVFRHKSSKRPFQIIFWFTVVLNCGVLGVAGSTTGAAFIGKILETW